MTTKSSQQLMCSSEIEGTKVSLINIISQLTTGGFKKMITAIQQRFREDDPRLRTEKVVVLQAVFALRRNGTEIAMLPSICIPNSCGVARPPSHVHHGEP